MERIVPQGRLNPMARGASTGPTRYRKKKLKNTPFNDANKSVLITKKEARMRKIRKGDKSPDLRRAGDSKNLLDNSKKGKKTDRFQVNRFSSESLKKPDPTIKGPKAKDDDKDSDKDVKLDEHKSDTDSDPNKKVSFDTVKNDVHFGHIALSKETINGQRPERGAICEQG